ncbi:retrovirus-related Pol polyprotein from transposon TNT 1-94, partial [Trifolium pratense]
DSSKSKGFHSGKSNFHNGNGFPKGTNRVCTFCGKSNHIVDNYYAKHGFPPHMQKRFANNASSSSQEAIDDDSSATVDAKENGSVHSTSSIGHPPLGASDHICGLLQWFHSFNDINPIHVKLPNGHYAIAKQCGTIKFSSDFVLTNEKNTKRTIGSGDKVEDLYYLVISNKLVCNSSTSPFVTIPDSALWHFRLGILLYLE